MRDVPTYVVSLPERAARAAVAVTAGALREVSDVALPRAVRDSKLYQATVARLLRIAIELVGDVRGVYQEETIPVGELAGRKAVGNVVELASIAAIGWSPLWLLAAASDVMGGSKAYLRALVAELAEAKLLPSGTDVSSYEDLLTRLEATSAGLADAVDLPPLKLADARRALERMRNQGKDLPSPDELGTVFAELTATARREGRSLSELSAAVGLAAARAGIELGNAHIFEYYREAFGAIGREGLLAFLRRIATPYVARAGAHFDPAAPTYTERMMRWLGRRGKASQAQAIEADGEPPAPR